MGKGSACGKAILLGEHAVVYGQPAIAVPLADLRAQAWIRDALEPVIEAPDLGRVMGYESRQGDGDSRALWHMIEAAVDACGGSLLDRPLRLTLRSDVPVARGLGSGTAVATATTRAVGDHMQIALSASEVSALVFESEVLLHGTPSGIDNTVVAWERPVWFVKGARPEVMALEIALALVVGDTGVVSGTREAVAAVRADRDENPRRMGRIIERIGDLACAGREAIATGDVGQLGTLMNHNHCLLREMGVSCPELDQLVMVAREAGALGSKLSGGGLGGCMIALVTPERREGVMAALAATGAEHVYYTTVTGRLCRGEPVRC